MGKPETETSKASKEIIQAIISHNRHIDQATFARKVIDSGRPTFLNSEEEISQFKLPLLLRENPLKPLDPDCQ